MVDTLVFEIVLVAAVAGLAILVGVAKGSKPANKNVGPSIGSSTVANIGIAPVTSSEETGAPETQEHSGSAPAEHVTNQNNLPIATAGQIDVSPSTDTNTRTETLPATFITTSQDANPTIESPKLDVVAHPIEDEIKAIQPESPAEGRTAPETFVAAVGVRADSIISESSSPAETTSITPTTLETKANTEFESPEVSKEFDTPKSSVTSEPAPQFSSQPPSSSSMMLPTDSGALRNVSAAPFPNGAPSIAPVSTDPSNRSNGNQTIAYCVKCKSKKMIRDPLAITLKNGRPAVRGFCLDCGTKVVRIGSLA